MSKTLENLNFEIQLIRNPISKKSENWQDMTYQWQAKFKTEGGFFTVDYFTGQGLVEKRGERIIPKKPTVKDVIYALYGDSRACNQSFNDWCSDFGYDSDSLKALNTYQACCESGVRLRKLGLSVDYLEKEFSDY